MSWSDFNPRAMTREELAERIADLEWRRWRPVGIVLHNTAAPTLAQWVESGPRHRARIRNLADYYKNLGWSGGPHWFVSRNFINEFSNPLRRGTHSPSFNASYFGIEMVGDYSREPFNTGDGALVRDNAVYLMALLCDKFGWSPAKAIKFHKEDPRTDHDCPGKYVNKRDIIARVEAAMRGDMEGPPAPKDGEPDPPPKWKAPDHPAFAVAKPALRRQRNIVATVFGGTRELSAYGGRVDPSKPGVALPYRFEGARPLVRVWSVGNEESVLCKVVDVGPWNTDDPYWENGTRPQAETGIDEDGRRTNLAGIDLTPAAAAKIGLDGKGKVDWAFEEVTDRSVAALDDDIGDGFLEPKKLIRSKTAWASAGGIATSILTAMSDWKVMAVFGMIVLIGIFGYIIWDRRSKPDIIK